MLTVHRLRVLFTSLLGLLLGGCSPLAYYGQAAAGQWHLLNQRRPVADVLADPATPAELRQRLATTQSLREFASRELALPDNSSYRCYADLGRPWVVMNVFATPELSLEPRRWCFPVAGCVSYRGYFDGAAADRFARALRDEGDDVHLGRVPAYSTLGWFDDPLLNTFIDWPTGRIAELMFHELAHQRLYVPGDTDFNESFATAVGRLGTERWLAQHGRPEDRRDYAEAQRHQEEFLNLVLGTRAALAELYASDRRDPEKRAEKQRLLAGLQENYQAMKRRWGGYAGYDHWFAKDLNNAKLASLSSYTRLAPAFAVLFAQAGGQFPAFYAAVETLSRLPPEVRSARLAALLPARPPAGEPDLAVAGDRP